MIQVISEAQLKVEMTRRLQSKANMLGWEAYGCISVREETQPVVVRRVGTCEAHPTPPPDEHLHEWPEGELHDEVAGVAVTFYGDDIHGAYIHAWGRAEDEVRLAWERAAGATQVMLLVVWVPPCDTVAGCATVET